MRRAADAYREALDRIDPLPELKWQAAATKDLEPKLRDSLKRLTGESETAAEKISCGRKS